MYQSNIPVLRGYRVLQRGRSERFQEAGAEDVADLQGQPLWTQALVHTLLRLTALHKGTGALTPYSLGYLEAHTSRVGYQVKSTAQVHITWGTSCRLCKVACWPDLTITRAVPGSINKYALSNCRYKTEGPHPIALNVNLRLPVKPVSQE